MVIKIIATGGTFDKRYDERTGSLVFDRSHLPDILQRARVTLPIDIQVMELVDSLEMTEAHRRDLLSVCEAAKEDALVIVHGTDTMCETAQFLSKAEIAKTIVLTGAMIPYEVIASDAFFNLGFALGVAQLLPHGIYLAMNGQMFPWDNARKNREAGIFERLMNH